jgi:hypothetical protein
MQQNNNTQRDSTGRTGTGRYSEALSSQEGIDRRKRRGRRNRRG